MPKVINNGINLRYAKAWTSPLGLASPASGRYTVSGHISKGPIDSAIINVYMDDSVYLEMSLNYLYHTEYFSKKVCLHRDRCHLSISKLDFRNMRPA